jgi:GMP synthase (glutamine-hydrolysing)
MDCIALYHVGFEDLGEFAEPLQAAGYSITYHTGTRCRKRSGARRR